MSAVRCSPADVAHALSGMTFPAGKQELIDFAQTHGNADRDTLATMQGLPDTRYGSMLDVFKGVDDAG